MQNTNKRRSQTLLTDIKRDYFLNIANLRYILVDVNGNNMQALVARLATVAVYNKNKVKTTDRSFDAAIEVQSFIGENRIYTQWSQIMII